MQRLIVLLSALFLYALSAHCQQVYHDAAIYDLVGNVKEVTKFYDGEEIRTVFFKSDGQLDKLEERDSYKFDKWDLEINDKGLVEKRTATAIYIPTNKVCQLTYSYKYDANNRVCEESYEDGEMRTVYTYYRDSNGVVISRTSKFFGVGMFDGVSFKYTFSDTKTDAHGNWIYRVCNNGSRSTVQTRTITYWDDASSSQSAAPIKQRKEDKDGTVSNTITEAQANDSALILYDTDLTVSDLLQIPFFSGFGRVSCADLVKSMKRQPEAFRRVLTSNLSFDPGTLFVVAIDYDVKRELIGITLYGNDLHSICYSLSTKTLYDPGYITGVSLSVCFKQPKDREIAIEELVENFAAAGITLSESKYTKRCKRWKGENDKYKVYILVDKVTNKSNNSFSLDINYKDYKALSFQPFRRVVEAQKKHRQRVQEMAKKMREATLRRKQKAAEEQ